MGTTYTVANDGKVTLTNDLAVDTNVLLVDAGNNWVGINKTPTVPLDVSGAVAISGNVAIDTNVLLVDVGNNWVGINKTPAVPLDVSGAVAISGNVAVDTNVLLVDVGNNWVGINKTPTLDLDVAGAIAASNNVSAGTLSIGAASPNSVAILDMVSTAKGVRFPQMTNTQRNSISAIQGLVIDSTTDNKLYRFDGALWNPVGAGHTIQDEGSSVTQRLKLNFVGAAVTVSDDVGNDASIVTVSGNGSQPVRENFVATAGQTTFVVVQTFTSGNEWVYWNGRLMRNGASYDYQVSGQNIVFNTGLSVDDKVTVEILTVLNTANAPTVEEFTATAGQTTFALTNTLVSGQESVYANGLRKSYGASNDYTISGNSIVFNAGRGLGDRVVIELWTSATAITSRTPQWQTYTVPYGSFTAAGLTESITLFTLAAGQMIHNVVISHTASFTGGSISAYTVSVGIIGTLAKYANAFNVFQAPATTLGQVSSNPGMEDTANPVSIKITATSVGGNLNTAAAGSVTIKVLVSQVF